METITRNLKGIYTIWYRDLMRFLRDRARIIASLAQPLLFLFIFGQGLSPAISSLGGGNLNFTQFMFPGILAMTVLFTSIFSAVSIVWDREFGFLKEVMVAPVSRVAVAIGKIAGGSTIAIFQGLIIMILVPVLGIPLTFVQLVVLVGIMFLLAIVMSSLGILIAARQKTMEGFQMIMQFMVLPMFFLSGAFFPLNGVPIWMTWLSRFDPVTYGVDPLRQVALRESVSQQVLAALSIHPIAFDLMIMAVMGIIFLIPAVWLFSKQD